MSKLSHSVLGGVLFAIFASPLAYNLTSKALGTLGPDRKPTALGIGVHTVIFTLVVRYFMSFGINCGDSDQIDEGIMAEKITMISLYSGALFALISSTVTNSFKNGYLISILIYTLAIRLSMEV